MRVVVTEKPSVARDLARVLGVSARHEGYLEGRGLRITWCRGHLLELLPPDAYTPAWKPWRADTLPMVPERFALGVRPGAEDQWAVVARLLQDPGVSEVVNACDAGREGELIFRYAYAHAGCRRPVLRLWTSSLTDEALRAAWQGLRPSAAFDPLADAARCRSEADWLVGMNATRAMTVRNRDAGGAAMLSVGRVQTPTLAMIVGRDAEIEAFVPETYWRVEASLTAEAGSWTGRWTRVIEPVAARAPADDDLPVERLPSLEAAEQVAAAARGRSGRVAQADRRTVREPPPLLYDLTELQRRANRRYGLSAQRTLEVAQALYERHKLITYPRTDSRHLTPDVAATLPAILDAVATLDVYRPHVEAVGVPRPGRRVVDADEVGDHHAILPTDRPPSPGRLSPDEKRVYDLVVRRTVAALLPDAVFDSTTLVVEITPEAGAPLPEGVEAPLRFRARGRVCREAGWQAVDPPKARRDTELPPVQDGDEAVATEVRTPEGQTRPPRPYDDASLLKAMETAGRALDEAALRRALKGAGLGTPATRAAILQTLLDRKYVVRDGRALRATEAGRALIAALPTDSLRDAALTGQWEARLSAMAEGRDDAHGFLRDVVDHVRSLVEAIATQGVLAPVGEDTREAGPSLGPCPACGTPVRARGPVYTCETGRSCPFVVFATMSGRAVSARMVKALLRDGRTDVVKGFRSKRTGKTFDAGLVVRDDHTVGLWFADAPPADPSTAERSPADPSPAVPMAPPAAAPVSSDPVGMPCPACGEGRLVAGRAAWGCSRWREGCGWTLAFTDPSGQRLSGADAVDRVRRASRAAQAGRPIDTRVTPPR